VRYELPAERRHVDAVKAAFTMADLAMPAGAELALRTLNARPPK
jgi:hypothetical protein